MDSEGKLSGKKAIVTGSGTGIGREVALEFARQGADVVLHYAHAAAGAESAAEEIRSMGHRAAVFPADFDRIDEVLRLADQAIAFLGRVDCLVNNAGITFNRPFFAVTPEQFDRLYHVNVRAQFFLLQRVAADMLKHGGGSVCNLTSIHGLQGAPSIRSMRGPKARLSRTPAPWVWNWRTRGSASTPLLPVAWWSRITTRPCPASTRRTRAAGPSMRFPWAAPALPWTSPGWPSSSAPMTRSSSSGRRSWPTAAPYR